MFSHTPFPPRLDEAESVAHQLHEGGGHGEQAHLETAVADGGVDGDETARIADTTHPKCVNTFGGDNELALHVGDSATMRHLTDDVRVTYRPQAICTDHITEIIHSTMRQQVVTLRESGNTANQQKQYDELSFQS